MAMSKWLDRIRDTQAQNGRTSSPPINVSANGTTTVPAEHLHQSVLRHFAEMKKKAAAIRESEEAQLVKR